jgi:hypothetical protein
MNSGRFLIFCLYTLVYKEEEDCICIKIFWCIVVLSGLFEYSIVIIASLELRLFNQSFL